MDTETAATTEQAVEVFGSPRRRGSFPEAWGPPPPPGNDYVTAGWIKACICEGRARQAAGEHIAWLRPSPAMQIERRREDPSLIAARARLRRMQLELLARR